jgi:FKBP-type peptidyl-prolyl cis-trans isomerase
MKRFLVYSLLAALTSTGLQSCLKSNEVDSVQVATDNDAAIKQYVAQNSGTASYSASPNGTGLYYAILKANPNGKKPSTGEEVTFSYTLYNLTNQALDSSKAASLPYFVYGLNSLLPGLQEGLSLIREGEKARFLLPSYLAYGSQAQTAFNLPANSPVRFDIELVRSRNEEQQISDYVASTALATSLSATTPLNVVRSTSGLRLIKTLSKPTGASITSGQSVTVNYSGQTLRATAPFDKSSDGSFGFTLGRNQLIAGFEEGVLQMRIGEKATVVFPSSIGYGTTGQRNASGVYVILPYSPLRFDIEVVNAK